jgi:hypothetical protein
MAMDNHLTEISDAYLFNEYLLYLGINTPGFNESWECSRNDRVIARVKYDKGHIRYYIAAATLMHSDKNGIMN